MTVSSVFFGTWFEAFCGIWNCFNKMFQVAIWQPFMATIFFFVLPAERKVYGFCNFFSSGFLFLLSRTPAKLAWHTIFKYIVFRRCLWEDKIAQFAVKPKCSF